jgi:tetratricopeptide (TPR) repeat protein
MMQDLNHNSLKDLFISYNSADRLWAEWIAWQLEEEGYSTVIQAWDFRPESSFALEMDKAAKEAEHTIVVLSPDYLDALDTQPEWAATLKRGPTSEEEILLPVHVRECRNRLKGLLELIVYIDLVGLDESESRERLLAGVRHEASKPRAASSFPKELQRSVIEHPRFPALPSIWNVPARNPFFTDNEYILNRLYEALQGNKTVALTYPQAICGLGGIGKTQTALEYTYKYHNYYQAVLWVTADTRERLTSDFVTCADLLNLPEKDAQDQSLAIAAVKRWLKDHTDWLLIFDSADDLALARDFLPSTSAGHILLTTRAQAMGRMAQRIEIEKMEPNEGALFLLRRAKIIEPDAPISTASDFDRAKAREISKLLDGLPLALDQAGAYIEETGSGLSGYLERYRRQSASLLQRRGAFVLDHPEPVATTWSLSFEKVKKANPAAADLLRLFAFLYSDAIPEEIITEGAPDLGPVLDSFATNLIELDDAIAELHKYSLVRRNPESKTLTIHRLVQAVLRDEMDEYTQRQWAERAVRAVNQAFPDVEFATWSQCERCLSQAQACAALIEQWRMAFPEAARLLNQTGSYLRARAQYIQAEPLFQRALAISEQALGSDHPDVATSLNNLAELYYAQGKYVQAEPLFQRALAISEQTLGSDHPDVATSLNNLALLYVNQGRYVEAEPLYQRTLVIREQTLGPEHPQVAQTFNDLASLYLVQGKFDKAEPFFQRALAIRERTLGPEHPLMATSLNNLALLYYNQGKYAQAEPLFQRALAIYEKTLGPEHPGMARGLNNLATLYVAQGKYVEAEPLFQRALAIREKVLGPEHPDVASILNNLAELYYAQGKYAQAEPLFQRALAIYEKVLGPEHPDVARALENYAVLLRKTNRDSEAISLETRAKAIQTKRAQENPTH